MKVIKSIIIILLIASCSNKKSEQELVEFDKILGKENVETLEYLVSDFEDDFLKRQYPDLNTENSYRQFLIDLRDGKIDNWERISKEARNRFKSSNLRLEMYEFPDSAWVLKNSSLDKIEADSTEFLNNPNPYIKSRFKKINPYGSITYAYRRSEGYFKNSNFDSIISRELETPSINYIGKYAQALEAIKNKSEFHSEFCRRKSSAGVLLPKSTAKVMLSKKIDLNDKLNRRIIVLEFVY